MRMNEVISIKIILIKEIHEFEGLRNVKIVSESFNAEEQVLRILIIHLEREGYFNDFWSIF